MSRQVIDVMRDTRELLSPYLDVEAVETCCSAAVDGRRRDSDRSVCLEKQVAGVESRLYMKEPAGA